MPNSQGGGGGSEGAGGGSGEVRGQTLGWQSRDPWESGKAEEAAATATKRDRARGGGLLEVAGFAAGKKNPWGRPEWWVFRCWGL